MKTMTECLEELGLGDRRFLNRKTLATCMGKEFLRRNTGGPGMEEHPPEFDECEGCHRMMRYISLTAPEDLRGDQPVSMKEALQWAGRMDRFMLAASANSTEGETGEGETGEGETGERETGGGLKNE